jgi:acetyltransferase-like isoleucine patch superfamily enzyme
MKSALRSAFGRAAARIDSWRSRYVEKARSDHLQRIARIDPTARLLDGAGIANNRQEPDLIRIGARSVIAGELIVFPQGGQISIGDRSFIGPGSRLWSAASITIGNYVLVAHNVNIHDNMSHSMDWRERRREIDELLPDLALVNHDYDLRAAPIVIEDDVWIGFGATIFGGVRIGRGAVIGAGAFVTKDVPDFAVAVGNPMRLLPRKDESGADAQED